MSADRPPYGRPDGYLAHSPSANSPRVLVLHAWWGLNDTIKQTCDRLAEAGFVAFAPDLYHGGVTDTIEGAEALSGALEGDAARADIAAAMAFLEREPGSDDRRLAVVAFSLGAYFALELSVREPEAVHAVVVFYGSRTGDYNGSKSEYLGHFAASDPYESPEDVAATEAAIRRAGRPVMFHTYPQTGHWFFEPDRVDAYAPGAAVLAWERTLEFLRGAFQR